MRLLLSWLGYIGCMLSISLSATAFIFKSIEYSRVIDSRGSLEFAIFSGSLLFGASMVGFIVVIIGIHNYAKTPEPKGKK